MRGRGGIHWIWREKREEDYFTLGRELRPSISAIIFIFGVVGKSLHFPQNRDRPLKVQGASIEDVRIKCWGEADKVREVTYEPVGSVFKGKGVNKFADIPFEAPIQRPTLRREGLKGMAAYSQPVSPLV